MRRHKRNETLKHNLGPSYLGHGRCFFQLWAPAARTVELRIVEPVERIVPLTHLAGGYFAIEADNLEPGTRYFYRLNGGVERPDPASRFQPLGVHGPSEVVDPAFDWQDQCWGGLPLSHYITYELHVGTFSSEGTFDAIIPYLSELKELGITAVELLPVAQFPGNRNWGYDGVYPFAVHNSYGGPNALKRLVDACHRLGLAVILDVVYNHLGPEGNYLGEFAPYFTDRYQTPWGPALNFDGPESDHVRRYFIENALHWVADFHIDALRLDAVHAILDHSPYPFLEELGQAVHLEGERLNRRIYLIPESTANDSRLIRSRELGGYGLDAQWNDDFHHALRGVLTGERTGYYEDYGEFRQLVKAYREGFVYSGEYSEHRRRRHGTSTKDIPAQRLVVFAQNHDQVGNRMLGERLTQLVSFEELKLAAGAVILAPFLPLLFMGEEYGDEAPFQYFISHGDPDLVQAVRDGRRREFATFGWQQEPPDPQDEATFLRAKLNHRLRRGGRHRLLWEFHQELFRLRKTMAPLTRLSKDHCEVTAFESERVLVLRRWSGDEEAVTIFNFADSQKSPTLRIPEGRWRKALDSSDPRWQSSGRTLPSEIVSQGSVELALPPRSLALFARMDGENNGRHRS